MIGWFLDIALLKSILPTWVTMKFTTATSFFIAGILIASLAHYTQHESDIPQFFVVMGLIFIFLIMTTLLVSYLLEFRTGLEDLFVQENFDAVGTVAPGLPSLGTMIAFLFSVLPSFSIFLDRVRYRTRLFVLNGCLILFLGGIALVGYLLSIEELYYLIEGVSTGMAIHTAVLFVVIGLVYIALGHATKEGGLITSKTNHAH